ncbi:hypothetical protein TNCV_4412581 [Trichonephila clavipes]|nr:hypothetical protein TNCV_4412581 [Trichonephila clavipes]
MDEQFLRLEVGQRITTVEDAIDVSKSVISRLKKAGNAEGENALRKHAWCRCRNTTTLDDDYIAVVTKRNRNFTPSQIAANLSTATARHISARTMIEFWFVCTEACLLHPTSTTSSSRPITLV